MLQSQQLEQLRTSAEAIFSVGDLLSSAKSQLEYHYKDIWVEGEIGQLTIPSSGHAYFQLKDQNHAMRCVFFKNPTTHNAIAGLETGTQVLLKGTMSVYTARGDMQFIVRQCLLQGEGLLQQQFQQIQKQLQQQGLFDPEHKKTLPSFIKHIALITSSTGAAIGDITRVLSDRYPLMRVSLYPSLVQGEQAPASLINAIAQAEQNPDADVILLTRGGGSMEDLWAFNDVALARAIFHCKIPIVSAVGHEMDYTIADYVADMRAATPSAAAERLSPCQKAIQKQLLQSYKHISDKLRTFILQKQQHLDLLESRLTSPKARISHQKQMLHAQAQYLNQTMMQKYRQCHGQQSIMQHRISASTLKARIHGQKQAIAQYASQMHHSLGYKLLHKSQLLQQYIDKMSAFSPLETLKRGYSISSKVKTDKNIASIKDLSIDEEINIRYYDGQITAKVLSLEPLKPAE